MNDGNGPKNDIPNLKFERGADNIAKNVVQFPKHFDGRRTESNATKRINNLRKVDKILEHHSHLITKHIAANGYDVFDSHFANDFCLVIEALRSTLYRYIGEDHPLHKVIEERPEEYMAYFVGNDKIAGLKDELLEEDIDDID